MVLPMWLHPLLMKLSRLRNTLGICEDVSHCNILVAWLLYTAVAMVPVIYHHLAGTCYLLCPATVEVAVKLRSLAELVVVVAVADSSMLARLATIVKGLSLALVDE
jgi:hypothetical protein